LNSEVGRGWADLVAILRHALAVEAGATALAPLPRVADLEAVTALSRAHRVEVIVAKALETAGVPLPPSLADARAQATVRSLAAVASLRDIAAAFGAESLPWIAWKGPALAVQAWGDAATRRFDDLDVVVRPEDLDRAVAAVEHLGWRSRHPGMSPAQARVLFASQLALEFTRAEGDPGLLELHWAFGARRYTGFPDVQDVLRRAVSMTVLGVRLPAPALADALLLHAVHATKHGWSTLEDVLTFARLRAMVSPGEDVMSEAMRVARGAADALGARTALALGEALVAALFDPAAQPAASTAASSAAPHPSHPSHPLPHVARLVTQVMHRWSLGHTTWRSTLSWDLAWTDGPVRRARLLARSAFDPTLQEWHAVRLPAALGPLYRIVRPARLAWRALGRGGWLRR
jgi:hypothetical protein